MFMCWICGIARFIENVFFQNAEKAYVVVEKSNTADKLNNRRNDRY